MNNTLMTIQDDEVSGAAARRGRAPALRGLPMVRMLIDASADVNAQDKGGRTALMIAVERGWADVVEALIKSGADLNARDEKGRTALMFAVSEPSKTF